jgi:CDP-paratose 2-epimerase
VPLIFASTNKVYGDLGDIDFRRDGERYAPQSPVAKTGISEERSLDFHTPYGCSKGSADQYVLDYARSFGIPTVVFRMSCIYGRRQMGTEDQGWVAHFLIRALAGEPITIYGDGRQVRDVLDISDTVDAYTHALDRIRSVKGRAFNLGGGPCNAISLLELVDEIGAITGRKPELRFEDWRQGDQRWYVSDTSAAKQALGLPEPRPWRDGVAALADWLRSESRPQIKVGPVLTSAAE